MFWILLTACQPEPQPLESEESLPPVDSLPVDSPPHSEPPDTGTARPDAPDIGIPGTGDPRPEPALFNFKGSVPTNLLVISLDTTRRDQLGIFSGLDTTPFWDSVLEQSVLMENHRSCSCWTGPSMLCATTGILPVDEGWWPTAVYGDNQPYGDPDVPYIPDTIPNLAQAFGDSGYRTAVVTTNIVFSSYNSGIVSHYQEEHQVLSSTAVGVNRRALNVAQDMMTSGQPWFLHLHFLDPHSPYTAPPDYAYELDVLASIGRDVTRPNELSQAINDWYGADAATKALIKDHILSVYRAEYRYWDEQIADLWNQLELMGALDDTLVVFFTDHGEQFGEHDQFYHGLSLNAEENRSTAAFWAPNLQPARWTGRTFHQDIAPTLYELMKVEPPTTTTGSVMGTAPEDRVMFTFNYLINYTVPVLAVFKGDKQLYYRWDGYRAFYDLSSDPDGLTDIYSKTDPKVGELWGLMSPKVDAVYAQWPHLTAPKNPGL